MSFGSEIVPIGDKVFMKSFGVFLWSGVSTTPGATALKRMLSFAYSLARLRVIASSPPFVTIATDAGRPAMGFSSSDAVMVVTLPSALRQDLFDCELGDEDEPFQVGGGETPAAVGAVLRAKLGYE